jgi:hypothetical protein
VANNNRPTWRPFSEYLEQLAKQREDGGLPLVEDVASAEYWQRRREMKT